MSTASTIYLSGEPVPILGIYEVVASEKEKQQSLAQPSIRQLDVGEIFPDYDGRAVSWHLLSEPSGPIHSRIHITS